MLSAVVAVLALVAGAVSLVRGRGRRASAVVSMSMALLPIAAVFLPALAARDYPPINDISTDLEDPPALPAAPTYPQDFKVIVAEAYPDVNTLELAAAPDEVWERVLEVAREQGRWRVPDPQPEAEAATPPRFLVGVAESAVFRFRDDFIIRVDGRGDRSLVDMRSRSRDGRGDLGVNAQRIREFMRALALRMQEPAP